MAELLTYAVTLSICLLLFVYFSIGAFVAVGAAERVPARIRASMYGRSAPASSDARSPTARGVIAVLCAALAAATQLMALSLLLADGPRSTVIALVGVELATAAGWTAYLVIRALALGRTPSSD